MGGETRIAASVHALTDSGHEATAGRELRHLSKMYASVGLLGPGTHPLRNKNAHTISVIANNVSLKLGVMLRSICPHHHKVSYWLLDHLSSDRQKDNPANNTHSQQYCHNNDVLGKTSLFQSMGKSHFNSG